MFVRKVARLQGMEYTRIMKDLGSHSNRLSLTETQKCAKNVQKFVPPKGHRGVPKTFSKRIILCAGGVNECMRSERGLLCVHVSQERMIVCA